MCPKTWASFLSKIAFLWFNGLIFKDHKQSLKLEDSWALDRNNITRFIFKKFNKVWIPRVGKEKKNVITKVSEGESVKSEKKELIYREVRNKEYLWRELFIQTQTFI
jgi:hypothetical protein